MAAGKLTKRQYEKEMMLLRSRLKWIGAKLAEMDAQLEAGSLAITAELSDYWNGLHDEQREIEEEIRQLEADFRRRDWTSYDWQQYEMICNNID
jgi:hypothetical protein